MSTHPAKPPASSSSAWQTILLFVAVAGFLFVIARLLLPGESREAGAPHPAVGKPAPAIELAALTGDRAFRLAEEKGKVVLVNFWGTWCPPCRMEFPRLMEATAAFRERDDFAFASVCVPGGGETKEELASDAAEFLRQQRAPFPALHDEDSAAFNSLISASLAGRAGVPFTVVIDREGKFAGVWLGYQTGDEDEVARVIGLALDQPAPK